MNRVLVKVHGGYAEIYSDEGVEVCLIDLDIDPYAETPEYFRTLESRAPEHGHVGEQT